jgi:hypothetical protein
MPTLGVVVLSLGKSKHLAECLQSVAWADEVLLAHAGGGEFEMDGGELRSLRIRKVASFADAEKLFSEIATDWVLQIWGEERLEAELGDELRSLRDRASGDCPGSYRIAIRSNILGQWIDGSVAGPSPAVRLRRKNEAMPLGWWEEAISSREIARGCIRDYGCAELARAVERVQALSDLWGGRLRGAARPPGAMRTVGESLKVFLKMLVLDRLFCRGLAGLTLSALASYAVLLSGAKLWEAKNIGARGLEREQ